MSYNGSGSFLINTAGQPVVSGTVISSTAFNALTADLATGLSTCITKDGQTTVTANIPMANYKFTGLGAGSGAADSANLSQVQSTVVKLLASVSGTDTITAVGSPTVAAYAAGQMFYFVAAGDNTGAVTINIDSLGAKAVTRDGSVALAAGDIKSGEVVVIVYDGTRFQVVSQLNSSGDARFANVSIASALNVGGVATVTGGSVLNGGVVINEPGADVDFRVEGDTDANLFFADASTDRIGIGISTPSEKVHIFGSSTATSPRILVQSHDTANATAGITFYGRNASNENKVSEIATSGSDLIFKTNNTQAMTLDSAGSLGIGVTSPGARLHVEQNTGSAIFRVKRTANDIFDIYQGSSVTYLDSTPAGGVLAFATAGTERARITSGGQFLVGKTTYSDTTVGAALAETGATNSTMAASANTTTTHNTYSTGAGAYRFYVGMGGTVYATNTTISAISDQRLKENVRDLDVGLDAVMALKPRKFDWKEGKGQDKKDVRGFIAQEFEQVFPDLIDEWKDPAPEGEEPYKSVRQDLIPVLVKAIQELKAELDAAKVKIAALEAK